jgi:hypothetical protein
VEEGDATMSKNIELTIAQRVNNGMEASVSLSLLEKLMYEPAIKHWIESTAKKLGCKATIHWSSDVVTFYPVSAL